MSLTSAGAIALKSLNVISSQINVASRNISGAGAAGVNVKLSRVATDETGVAFLGVERATNVALLRNLLSASSFQEAATVVSDSLARIDQALNLSDTSNSRAPSILVAKLKSALQTYSATPQNETAAQLAVGAAQEVVASLHDATTATQTERRLADEAIASAVTEVNDLLSKFGELNQQIIADTAGGGDVSDALDRRDGVLAEIAKRIGVSTVSRPNNDMVVYTDSGVTLFETTPRRISFQQTPNLSPGVSGAAVYIDSVRVTGAGATLALRSGSIRGLTEIRDTLAPLYQNQLDEIARGLVVAFAEKDQSGAGGPPLPGLFAYPGASQVPPPSLITGLAEAIALNPNVDPSRGGDASKLRDGGVSGQAAYVYNKGAAPGYADRIIELVEALSTPQSFDTTAGLGATGSVESVSAASNGWVAAQRQQTSSSTTYYDAVVAQTTQALSNATGVNLDDQMSQMLALENSYQASAKLLETVNSLFESLFAAVRS